MPTSHPVFLSHVAGLLIGMQPRPKSLLDVGCGHGKWGFLGREYLDVWHAPAWPPPQRAQIDAIEIHEPYLQSHHRAIYDRILIGDAMDLLPLSPRPPSEPDRYDVVICSNVLEHVPRDTGQSLLEKLIATTGRLLILEVPLGDDWPQAAIYGNDHETHRAVWRSADFSPAFRRAIALIDDRRIGLFCWERK